MLYTPDYPKASPEALSVRSISRTAKTGAEKAAIAAVIKDNGLPICDLSIPLLAVLFGTTVNAINKRRTRRGAKHRKTTLTEAFMRASPEERIEAVRVIGPDVVWNEMIVPVIDEDRKFDPATVVAASVGTAEDLTAKLEEPLTD